MQQPQHNLSWTRGLPPDSCDLSYVSLTPWTPCEGYDSFSRLTLYHHFALFRTNESQRHQSQAIQLLVPTYRAAPPYPHEMSPQRHWFLSGTHTNPRTQRNPVLFLLDSFTLILERPRMVLLEGWNTSLGFRRVTIYRTCAALLLEASRKRYRRGSPPFKPLATAAPLQTPDFVTPRVTSSFILHST